MSSRLQNEFNILYADYRKMVKLHGAMVDAKRAMIDLLENESLTWIEKMVLKAGIDARSNSITKLEERSEKLFRELTTVKEAQDATFN